MKEKITILLGSLFLFNVCLAKTDFFEIPLSYIHELNVYTTYLSINGQKPQKFLIDTASGLVIIQPSKDICPNCDLSYNAVSEEAFDVSDFNFNKYKTNRKQKIFKMVFGTAFGYMAYLKGNITNPSNFFDIDNLDIFAWIQGTNVHNILGLHYMSNPYYGNNTSFIYALVKKYNLSREFSLLECGQSGKSYMYIGGLPDKIKNLNRKQIPFTGHYEVYIEGIYDNHGHKIVNLMDHRAIIDSGCTRSIVLRPQELSELNHFLSTSSEYEKVESDFWNEGNRCLNPESMELPFDHSNLSNLNLKIKGLDGKDVDISFKPEEYINPNICGEFTDTNRVRYIFQRVKGKHLSKIAIQKLPIVIGGPLFQKYLVTFKFGKEKIIELRSNATLCKKQNITQ